MSKISLIILGLVLLVCLTAAAREEEEELSSLREVREAAPEARRRLRKKSKKAKRNRKGKGKGRKNTRKENKERRRGPQRKNTVRQSGRNTISEDCFEKSITIMKMWKDVIANFDRQWNRMMKQNETAGKKEGKKDQFGPVAQMLVEAGGGNKSNLSCGGNTTNDGAKQLKNLTDTLDDCKKDISAACDPVNIPQPNMTFIMMCEDTVTLFKDGAQECLGKTVGVNATDAADACTCWTNPALDAVVQDAKKCKASDEAKAISAALKNCTKAFGKCRKYEDDANTAISACTSDSSKLKDKASNLMNNKAALDTAKEKVASLANNSSRRLTRTASTCAEVITYAKMLAQMAEDSPASPEIITTAAKISEANVTCTGDEKTILDSLEASLASGAATIETALEAVQEQLQTLTGTTLASAEAVTAAPTTAGTVSTMAPGRRIRNFNIV